jgi:hypothetical protein
MVVNVHERRIASSAEDVGTFLDRLGGSDDAWWPAGWPPMVLESPLAVGVHGAHGPIRYLVTGYSPGESVEFTFDEGVGLRGTHRFDVIPHDATSCSVRHVVEGRTTGSMRLVWPLAMRWLHDAVLEDLLDQVASSAGVPPLRPARRNRWVRLIRRMTRSRVRAVDVPTTPLLASALPEFDWSDAYAVRRPSHASTDPQVWADAVFRSPPRWVGALLLVREALVRLVGIERAGGRAFDTIVRRHDEVLLGIDQGHLGFRVSVLCESDRVVISTVVDVHNRRGRLYWFFVRRLHPRVVRAMLKRAVGRVPSVVIAGAPA